MVRLVSVAGFVTVTTPGMTAWLASVTVPAGAGGGLSVRGTKPVPSAQDTRADSSCVNERMVISRSRRQAQRASRPICLRLGQYSRGGWLSKPLLTSGAGAKQHFARGMGGRMAPESGSDGGIRSLQEQYGGGSAETRPQP